MLRRKQKEETQKFHEQLENDRTLQQEQMKNMMEANMERAKRERELLEQKNQDHIESLKRQYEAKEARHAKEMKDMQENLNLRNQGFLSTIIRRARNGLTKIAW